MKYADRNEPAVMVQVDCPTKPVPVELREECDVVHPKNTNNNSPVTKQLTNALQRKRYA